MKIPRNAHELPGETWIEPESDRQRRARAIMPGGALRVVRADGVPDTYFSIRASVVVGGRRVYGYLTGADSPTLAEYGNPPERALIFRPTDVDAPRKGTA